MKDLQHVSDHILCQRIQAGDSPAFDALYLRYYEKLYGYFWVRLRSVELSRDFVQDVYMRLWTNRKNLNPDKSIRAYLYTTAKSIVINHYEKKSVRERARTELMVVQTTTEISDIFDLEAHIAKLIRSLPEDCRHLFLLSRMEGLTYSEIAQRLSFSIKKVERLMSKSLKILRTEYEKLNT
ncbi:RNA polymerase sigma-70 factor [bacterium]|nr:RNA polymerase sigma-70 factor [bacterium]